MLFVCFWITLVVAENLIKNETQSQVGRKFSVPQDSSKAQRIIGGEKTDISKVPYVAALLQNKKFYCGGTIVTGQHVVSTASCFVSLARFFDLSVRVGSNHHETGGDEVEVERTVIHDKYDKTTGLNDVAVIKLQRPISKLIPYKTVSFPTEIPKVGQVLLVSGWGSMTEEKGPFSPDLRSVNLTVMYDRDCRYRVRIWPNILPDTDFCANSTRPGHDACTGDNGGPAVRDNILVGIVSFPGCDGYEKPSIFTSVFQVKEWINSQIQPS